MVNNRYYITTVVRNCFFIATEILTWEIFVPHYHKPQVQKKTRQSSINPFFDSFILQVQKKTASAPPCFIQNPDLHDENTTSEHNILQIDGLAQNMGWACPRQQQLDRGWVCIQVLSNTGFFAQDDGII